MRIVVLGDPRNRLHEHVFEEAVIQQMLNRYRNDLDVAALPEN